MPSNTATRPTSLTTEADLDAEVAGSDHGARWTAEERWTLDG